MHCTSTTITSAIVGLLAATSAVLAAPAPRPQEDSSSSTDGAAAVPDSAPAEAYYPSATTTESGPLVTTTPDPLVYYAPVATLYPTYTSTYHSNNGAVDFHVSQALVSRNPRNGGADTSALVTFQLPEYYKDRSCNLVFDLKSSGYTAYGTKKAQLFTAIAPATKSAASWPSGNLRDQHLGTINVVAGGRATWEAGSGPGATNQGWFPCSQIAGKVFGGEVVPQGDEDYISWVAAVDGPKIEIW